MQTALITLIFISKDPLACTKSIAKIIPLDKWIIWLRRNRYFNISCWRISNQGKLRFI